MLQKTPFPLNWKQIGIQLCANCLLVYALQAFAMLSNVNVLAYLRSSTGQMNLNLAIDFHLTPFTVIGYIVFISWIRITGLVIALVISLIISLRSKLHWLNPILAALAALLVTFYKPPYFILSFAKFSNVIAETIIKGSLILIVSIGLYVVSYRTGRIKPAS